MKKGFGPPRPTPFLFPSGSVTSVLSVVKKLASGASQHLIGVGRCLGGRAGTAG
jgi:hypothetical protein